MKALARRLRAWLRWRWQDLGWQWLGACDALVLCFCRRSALPNGVLVVKLDAIGDFVVWLDAARALREIYPGKRITLYANAHVAELAERLPDWDEVRPVDAAKLRQTRFSSYRARLLRELRRGGWEIAVQPVFSREFLVGDSLMRASGAPERIGSSGNLSNSSAAQRSLADRWYTRLLPSGPAPMPELERNAEFMRHLGAESFVADRPTLPGLLELPERLRPAGPYFVVFPGAGWHGRRWPALRFAEVATALSRELGWTAVVCGSATEFALCQSIVEAVDVEALNFAGRTSLPEFAELIRGARLLVGNDTSAVHLASAVETPAVGVLGGGQFGRFLPYPPIAGRPAPVSVFQRLPCFHCEWICTQPHAPDGPVPCVGLIAVEDVLLASREALTRGAST